MKVLFFHVPSLGMYRLIEPVLVRLAECGHTVVHHNCADFQRYATSEAIRFEPYPSYDGYWPHAFRRDMNLYDLGLLLFETAEHIMSAVEAAVRREAPDVILHSKFMAAPKVIANKYGVPAACLTPGYIFHPRVVLDRERPRNRSVDFSNVRSMRRFRTRAQRFYETYPHAGSDQNDIFVNEESLNVVLGLRELQPTSPHISSRHLFVGPTVAERHDPKSYDVIYVSLGSIFSDNREFFELC